MKYLFIMVIGFILVSCSKEDKCYTCELAAGATSTLGDSVNFCEENFDNNTQFEANKDNYEFRRYTCTLD